MTAKSSITSQGTQLWLEFWAWYAKHVAIECYLSQSKDLNRCSAPVQVSFWGRFAQDPGNDLEQVIATPLMCLSMLDAMAVLHVMATAMLLWNTMQSFEDAHHPLPCKGIDATGGSFSDAQLLMNIH